MPRATVDPLRYYDLERFLFEDVHQRFHADHSIGAFDLFSIIRWKANRSKSRIARRLHDRCGNLETAARQITRALYKAPTHHERLRTLMQEWRFLLPMSSAILTVLWPEEFTVYDVRVCDELGKFHELTNRSHPDRVWEGYCAYRAAVERAVPRQKSLRDKDRFLWGRSALRQLQRELPSGFSNRSGNGRQKG